MRKERQTMRRHKRENQILKGLIRAAAGVAACVAGLILFFVFIWWRGQHTYPQTDKEAAVQRQQAEPLVIETPEPATEGSITIYTPDGAVYGYFGNIDIISDGRDGKQIQIELTGWLVGETHEEAESGVRE